MQNAASMVIDSRHDSTRRLNQSRQPRPDRRSREAARHRNVGDVHCPELVRPRNLDAA
jgi:hypothetical protein